MMAVGVILACDRKTQSSPPAAATPDAHDPTPTSSPSQTSTTPRKHFSGRDRAPRDVARELVQDQLRATALDSAHCLSPRAIKCGALDVVADFTIDSTIAHGDTAAVIVGYRVIGRLEQRESSLHFVQPLGDTTAHSVIDTVVVARDSTGWSLLRDVHSPRISALLVALYFQMPRDDEQRLITSAAIDSSELQHRPVLADPVALSILPRAVRDTLSQRGCRVPQTPDDTTWNIIRGSFLGPATNDLAVFCAIHGAGKILLFRDGAGSPVASLDPILAEVPELDLLPNPFRYPTQYFGCMGGITTLGPEVVVTLFESARTDDNTHLTRPERLQPHDAIADSDCDGLGNSHYWTGKRWVRLAGPDD